MNTLKWLLSTALLTILMSACGGGGESPSPTPAPSPVASPAPTPSPTPSPTPTPAAMLPDTTEDPALPRPNEANYVEAKAAARFLMQASFGPTAKSVSELMDSDFETWIDAQMALPRSSHLQLLEDRFALIGLERAPEDESDEEAWVRDLQRSDIWWENAIWGEDQLRQRVAFALSQILVISNVSDALFNDSRGIANYHDILAEHAFGNYRDLLEAVTLNPIMGEYLSMIRNQKANPEQNIRPDENYAREIMQLFSIGLVELNLDGSPRLDSSDRLIPTYGQDDIKALARVFTGWFHGSIDNWWEWVSGGDSEVIPMKAFPDLHDTDEKILFGDQVIAAGQTAQEDIDSALDILFAHTNIGPFISKQLIQRLVSSNPTPAYVSRVASVFNDNGNGVKGDLAAVVKAILLDAEARSGQLIDTENYGKIKEPILKTAALWRAFKAQGAPAREANGTLYPNRLRYRATDRHYGQRPYGSFSVFNFYRPDYQQPGGIKQAGLVSPEMQIHTESQLINSTNKMGETVFWRDTVEEWSQTEEIGENWDFYPSQMYLEDEKALSSNASALLDKINLLLLAGEMSADMYSIVRDYLEAQYYLAEEEGQDAEARSAAQWSTRLRVYDALYLVIASPEFAVQR